MPPPGQNAFSQLSQRLGHGRMVEDRSRELGARRALSLEQDMLKTQREQARISDELGNIQDRNSNQYLRGLREMEQRQTHLNDLQEQHTRAVRQSQTVMQRGFHDAAQSAGESIRNSIGGAINDAAQAVVNASKRAHQALIQTGRGLPELGDYATAMGGYTAMLDDALVTSLRYGQGVEEITAVQHRFIQAMNIDVAEGNFSDRVSRMSDTMAYLAARTGQSVDAVEQFASSALETFGRGGEAQIESFRRTMGMLSQIPAVLRDEMEAAGEEVGNLFSNPQTQMMIQTWTEQFADQATNISEMAAAMLLFQRNAAKAGHSTRTLNVLTNGLVQGIQGQRGANANTVRAGQVLQQRMQADPAFVQHVSDSLERRQGGLSAGDRELIEGLARGDSGLNASDLFHMLQGTAEGMDAFMEGMVGMRTGNVSITKEMLQAQGIDTGSDRDNLRLAQLIEQQGQGNVIDTTEMQDLLSRATEREEEETHDRASQYRNIGLAAEATERTAILMGQLMGWLTSDLKGVMIAAIIGAAGVGATHETAGEEQQRLTREWERALPQDLSSQYYRLPEQDRNQFQGMNTVELREALANHGRMVRRNSLDNSVIGPGGSVSGLDDAALDSLDAQRAQLARGFDVPPTQQPTNTTPILSPPRTPTPRQGARNVIDTTATPPTAPNVPWGAVLGPGNGTQGTAPTNPSTRPANAPGTPANPVRGTSPVNAQVLPNGTTRMTVSFDVNNIPDVVADAHVRNRINAPPGWGH